MAARAKNGPRGGRRRPSRGRRGPLWGLSGAVLALLLGWLFSTLGLLPGGGGRFAPGETPPVTDEGLWVAYIDVGQGDATLIVCEGEAMLIDAGLVSAGETVTDYLSACGVTELAYVVCTHAHEDHCGGLDDVVAAFPVETLFAPYTEFDASGAFTYFEDAAAERGLYVTVPPLGGVYTLGGASFTVVGPVGDYEDVNDTSLVLLLTYGGTRFLFPGDAGKGALADAAALGGFDLGCDVLKLGHHGSSSSTDAEILDLTRPSLAVASCGRDNRYGHPHEEVHLLLAERGVPLYRTDERGTIVLFSDGEKVYEAGALPDAA